MPMFLGSILQGAAQGQEAAQIAESRKLQQQKYAYDLEQSRQANARALQAEQAMTGLFKQFGPPPVSAQANVPPASVPGQAPAPGAASVPQMGPQQQIPNITPGQPAAPSGPAPQMANTTPGQTQYVPPYVSVQGAGQQAAARQAAMAASQQMAQPGLIAPPSQGDQPQPQQTEMTFGNLIQKLKVSGTDESLWPAIIDRMKPYMDMESRERATQAVNQHRQVTERIAAERAAAYEKNIESQIKKRGGGTGVPASPYAAPYDVPPTPGAKPKTQLTGEDFLKTLDPKVARDVQAVAEGRVSLKNFGSSKGNPERQRVLGLVNQYTDGRFNEQDIAAAGKALQAFSSGAESKLVRSANTINEHLVDLNEAVDALKNKDIQTFNRISNQISAWSGGVAPNDFNTVKTFVGDEVAKFLIPGVGAKADREEVKNLLSAANSPEQLKKAISRFESLMGGQLRSLQTQYKGATNRDDFDRLLNSRSKSLLGGTGQSAGSAEGVPSGWSVREK